MTHPATTFRFYPTDVERLFRIADVTGDETRGGTEMITGPWLADDRGRPCRSSLGVALDDVMGYLISGAAPEGQWAVSTEIHLDFILDPPTDGALLMAESWVLHRGQSTGLAGGRICDADGRLVATGTSRLQILPVTTNPGPSATRPRQISEPPDATSMLELLGAHRHTNDGASWIELAPTRALGNPLGIVHGGVLLCASEMAGLSELTGDAGFRTSSVHIAYLRPSPTDQHLIFTPTVVRRGRTFSVVQVVAHTADGKLCTTATVTASREPT